MCPLAAPRRGWRGERRRRGQRSPALEGRRGAGAPGRAQDAGHGVARPARGASAEARGVPAGGAVPAHGSAARRLREAPGFPLGSATAPPAAAPSPRSARTPGFSAQRAGSPGARVPRAKLGRGDSDPSAAHPLLRSSPRRGAPQSRGPRPGRLDPAPATGTKGNKTASNPPSRFRRDLTRRRRRSAGRWDSEEGARRRTPQRLPARGSDVKAPPPPRPGVPALPPPGAQGGREGMRRGPRGRGRGSWTLTRSTEAGGSRRGARDVGTDSAGLARYQVGSGGGRRKLTSKWGAGLDRKKG